MSDFHYDLLNEPVTTDDGENSLRVKEPSMIKRLQADLLQLQGNISNTERIVRSQAMKSPRRSSPVLEVRPPWNYGGSSLKLRPFACVLPSKPGMCPTDQSKRIGPSTRSRSSSRSAIQSPKNIVHKETIDAGDKKTIVEVTVQTKHQRRSSSVPRYLTDEYLASKLSNVGLSQKSEKYPAVTCEARKEPSWSNILSQKLPHPIPDKASVKRSCETTATSYQKRRSRSSNRESQFFHHQKPNECFIDVTKNFGNTPTSMSPQQKLKSLFKELKGISVNNPNAQMIILGIEEALANLSPENVEPPFTSLPAKTASVQQTLHTLSNGVLHESPKMLSPSHVGSQGQESVAEPNLLILSPDPLSSEQHSLKRKFAGCKGEAAPLIKNFLELLNSLPPSPPPESKHRSRRSHSKNEQVPIFKEQLEKACVVLEETCKRMEEESEKLKSENVEFKKILRGKEAELQTVLSTRQRMEKELAQIRVDCEKAKMEIQRLREQASKNRRSDHEKIITDFQKRVDELFECNQKLTYEMNVLRMEKHKLSAMLTNKTNEADRFRKEINILRGGHIIGVEDDEDIVVKKGPKKRGTQSRKRKNQRIGVNTSLSEEELLLVPASLLRCPSRRDDMKKEEQKTERNQKKDGVENYDENQNKIELEKNERNGKKGELIKNEENQRKVELENNENIENNNNEEIHEPKTSTFEETDTMNRSGNEVVLVSEVQLPLYFLPVGAEWQRKACKDLNLKLEVCRRSSPQPVPLGSPKSCTDIFPDGNCFFRCISLYLTGSQEQHECVRNAVVRFMTAHSSEFEESQDSEYIKRMQTLKTWATEVEIRATARMLNVPIFTYMKYNQSDWKWQRFGPGVDLSDEDNGKGGLYLKNTGSCHYDVVKVVHPLDYRKTP